MRTLSASRVTLSHSAILGARVYTALHVVSDLHLGGTAHHQIFKGVDGLVGLLDFVGAESYGRDGANRQVGFVINGDFIDFLAAPGATYFDPAGAASKLDDVIRLFRPIWDAFARFVANPGNELVVVLGNHDLELSLSDTKRKLVDSIARGNPEAQGRIQLCMDGTGFAARVGEARVLCVHGNEVDTFNVVDYEQLRRVQRDRQLGWGGSVWVPNAGTKLVIDIMNGIKEELPFVDLLKPETEAVVPILFALEQASRERLRSAISVGGRLAWDKVRRWTGLLSADQTPDPELAERAPRLEELLSAALPRATGGASSREAARELLAETERRFRSGGDPTQFLEGRDDTLGYAGALWKRLQGRDSTEILLEALERVQGDQSFNPLALDDTFRDLDELVAPDFQFLLAGHTHLERTLRRKRGGRYMNTGTWARLIRLRPDDLISIEQFRPVLEALRARSMTELDRAQPNRVLHRPAVASIWLEGGLVRDALHRVRFADGRTELEPLAS